MSFMNVNIKASKRCGFCKYWYDPQNQYIQPITPSMGSWKLDTSAKCMCLIRNINISANNGCSRYECKIQY
ncbi:MAG TPA: hypothetical protein DCS38_01415 [Ruminococcus sp.]|nr:hypothetical protein [Ruminococcus sp.]HBN10764.1 hypothetical protein [Ruminococcus sp.]